MKNRFPRPKIDNPRGDQGINPTAYNLDNTVEYLTALQGREGSLTFEKMARGDDTIGMILTALKNPVRSCRWTIPEDQNATDKEKAAADFVRTWFFKENKLTFQSLINQVLTFMEHGFSVFEVVYKLADYEGQKFIVPDLQQRIQTSIEHIYSDKEYIQQHTLFKGTVDIPFENLVFFTLNRIGNDLRGMSMIRNCYGSWSDKIYYTEWMGMGIQRNATGVPKGTVPKSVNVDDDSYIDFVELLKNFNTHEDAYMILEEGWEFELLEGKFDPQKAQTVIDAKDAAMARSTLLQFLLLGQNGGGGAYALSRDHSDMFMDGLQYIVGLIEQTFHRHIIKPMVKLNFGEDVNADGIILRGLNLNKHAGGELAEVLSKMTGYINPTVNDEIRFRDQLEMPALSDEEIKQRREMPAQPVIDDPTPQKVKLSEPKGRKELLDREIKALRDVMQANLLLIKDKLLVDMRNTMERGTIDIRGLKNVEVSNNKYLKNLEAKAGGLAMLGWNRSKKNAKLNKVKLAEDLDPKNLPDKTLKQYTLNQSQSIVDDQTESMKNKAILTASNGSLKKLSISQTISNVGKVVDDFIEGQKVSVGASLFVVQNINYGENLFNQQIEDQIWGYRFVGVDDGNQTDICKFYSKQGNNTFSNSGAELSIVTPPLHPNCRSYLEPIYKSEMKNRPEITDKIAPPSIQKQKSVY